MWNSVRTSSMRSITQARATLLAISAPLHWIQRRTNPRSRKFRPHARHRFKPTHPSIVARIQLLRVRSRECLLCFMQAVEKQAVSRGALQLDPHCVFGASRRIRCLTRRDSTISLRRERTFARIAIKLHGNSGSRKEHCRTLLAMLAALVWVPSELGDQLAACVLADFTVRKSGAAGRRDLRRRLNAAGWEF